MLGAQSGSSVKVTVVTKVTFIAREAISDTFLCHHPTIIASLGGIEVSSILVSSTQDEKFLG